MFSVGRSTELLRIARLGEAVDESALLVVGPSGSGKTHLLTAALRESTIDTVLLRTNPAEAAWPLAGISALLALVNDSQLPDLGDRSRLIATDPQGVFDAASDLLDIVRSLSLPPTLALVDDVDLMDGASQMLIGFMSGRLRHTGLRIVATASLRTPSPPLSRMSRLDLRPLPRRDMNRLALRFATKPVEEGGLFTLARAADGNPRALQEIIGELSPAELAGLTELRLPAKPRATTQRHAVESLRFVGSIERVIFDRLSLAPWTARAVVAREEPAYDDSLQDLIARGLVEQRRHAVRIRSPLLRSHLYWSMSYQERRKLHAVEQEACGDDARAAVWHESFGTTDRTMPVRLMEAAVSHAREGATTAAVEYAEQARSLSEGDSFSPELFADLCETFLLEGELTLAARYADVGYRMVLPVSMRLTFDLLRTRIEYLLNRQVIDLDFEAWLEDYSAANPADTRELLTVAAAYRALRFEPDAAQRLLDSAYSAGKKDSTDLAVAERVLQAVIGEAADASFPSASGTPTGWPAPDILLIAFAEMLEGNYPAARRLCDLVLGRRFVEWMWTSLAYTLLAEIEIRSGRFTNARRAIARSGILESADLRSAHAAPLEAWLAYADNRVDDAIAIIKEQLENIDQDPGAATLAYLHVLRGELALLQDDPDEAIRALSHAQLLDRNFDNPALVQLFPDLIEAHYRARRLPEIRDEIERFAERCARHPSAWARRTQARVAAILGGDDEEGIALCDGALELVTADGLGVARGRLLMLRAERLDRVGRGAWARRSYLEAREAFSATGAMAWVAYVDRHLLDFAIEPPEGDHVALLGRLSEEERRIVDYVQLGHRNKEIATKLHISVRTVELRLTHIYRLAHVSSRSHLIARLAR